MNDSKDFMGQNVEDSVLDDVNVDNNDASDVSDDNRSKDTIPSYRLKEEADKRRAAEQREEMLLRNNMELEERIKRLESRGNKKELDYDEQIDNLLKLKDEHPERENEIIRSIAKLEAQKVIDDKLSKHEEKYEQDRDFDKQQRQFTKALEKAVELVPDITEPSSDSYKRYFEIGLEDGLLVKNKYGQVNVLTPNAPVTIARIIAAEKGKNTTKQKIQKMPISGNSSKGSKGLKSTKELMELRSKDRKAYDNYMRKHYKSYE